MNTLFPISQKGMTTHFLSSMPTSVESLNPINPDSKYLRYCGAKGLASNLPLIVFSTLLGKIVPLKKQMWFCASVQNSLIASNYMLTHNILNLVFKILLHMDLLNLPFPLWIPSTPRIASPVHTILFPLNTAVFFVWLVKKCTEFKIQLWSLKGPWLKRQKQALCQFFLRLSTIALIFAITFMLFQSNLNLLS